MLSNGLVILGKKKQTLEALRKVAPFATLDAKLLSALTNIITGDFARKVDTFKETEATAGRIVRGRQVLFMLHDHFSTNIKHGATYALQDLFSVQLRGENLKSFISNWDQVLAGIVQTPDESVLETLFYKQVKNCKAIQHDMNEYHRADEGTEKDETTVSLFLPCDATLTVRGWRQIVIELPKVFQSFRFRSSLRSCSRGQDRIHPQGVLCGME